MIFSLLKFNGNTHLKLFFFVFVASNPSFLTDWFTCDFIPIIYISIFVPVFFEDQIFTYNYWNNSYNNNSLAMYSDGRDCWIGFVIVEKKKSGYRIVEESSTSVNINLSHSKKVGASAISNRSRYTYLSSYFWQTFRMIEFYRFPLANIEQKKQMKSYFLIKQKKPTATTAPTPLGSFSPSQIIERR